MQWKSSGMSLLAGLLLSSQLAWGGGLDAYLAKANRDLMQGIQSHAQTFLADMGLQTQRLPQCWEFSTGHFLCTVLTYPEGWKVGGIGSDNPNWGKLTQISCTDKVCWFEGFQGQQRGEQCPQTPQGATP